MGFKDFIRKSSGLDYLDNNKSSSTDLEKKSSKKLRSSGVSDKFLRNVESDLRKIISKLEDIQEKLRVKRGIG